MSNAYLELYQAIILVMIVFCIITVLLVIVAIILKKKTDKIIAKYEEDYQNSLNILSEVKTNDKGLDIDDAFSNLEKNNIDISCNIKLD